MALVVEDGTGLADADAYVSLIEVAAHQTLFGEPAGWSALTDTQKEVKIRYLTMWFDKNVLLKSYPLVSTQALELPRQPFYDRYGRVIEGVPAKFKTAFNELLAYHHLNDLSTFDMRGTVIASETVGESSVTYKGGVRMAELSQIMRQFSDYLTRSSSIKETVRC